MESLKVTIQIKRTLYNRILLRTLMILVNLNLLSSDDAATYYMKEATFKWRIGDKGEWQYIKGKAIQK